MSNHTAFSPVQTLSSAVERLKACDDAFRKQLQQERQAHEQLIQTLTNEKQREIEQANTRVRHDKHTPRIGRFHTRGRTNRLDGQIVSDEQIV